MSYDCTPSFTRSMSWAVDILQTYDSGACRSCRSFRMRENGNDEEPYQGCHILYCHNHCKFCLVGSSVAFASGMVKLEQRKRLQSFETEIGHEGQSQMPQHA